MLLLIRKKDNIASHRVLEKLVPKCIKKLKNCSFGDFLKVNPNLVSASDPGRSTDGHSWCNGNT